MRKNANNQMNEEGWRQGKQEMRIRLGCTESSELLHFQNNFHLAVRESANESAASAASPVYVKSQAVIKSAASAASLRGGHASGRLDHDFLLRNFWGALAHRNILNASMVGVFCKSA